ncbi:GGDEF domain-containing protein [Shewanella sp. UCD-KL12]|uniref:GGDEF domain-containing protein n=1 Tax=Shewanella sp. UCD-KL12 TaxID=1917163 RepID=UPI0021162B12|nr:GGDEF domain-containing protein [Shewanella sp. UCD-KL12]
MPPLQVKSVIALCKHFPLWIAFTYIILLSFSPISRAEETDPFLETFELLESGKLLSADELKVKLDYLKANINADDTSNYQRLQRALCWNIDAFNPDKRDEGLTFVQQQLESELIKQSAETVADLMLCRGWFYQFSGEVSLALDEYNKVVAKAYQLESPRLIADARGLRGAMYSFQGNYASALEDLLTAQQLYESLNLEIWSRYNLAEIATSYRRFGDPQTAIKYYDKLVTQFTHSGDLELATGITTEMAIALEELGENEAALEKYLQSYDYWHQEEDELAMSFVSVNLAGTLIKLQRLDEASKYLNFAQKHVLSSEEAFYSFMMLFRAQISFLNNQSQQALPFIEESEAAFNRVKNSRGLTQLYMLKSQIYADLLNWELAYHSLEQYIRLHNELDIKQQSHRTTEMRTRFNTKQVESENTLLIEKQEIKERELKILQQNRYLQFTVIFLALIVIINISFFAYKQAKKSKLLEVLALTDHLTQLPNRRHTYTLGEQLFAEKAPLSLILFDADYFKKINDLFGHDIGDQALIALANISSSIMRSSDLVGRVGGEEFLVILPNTELQQAREIAERLVKAIAQSDFSHIEDKLAMTISAGVASRDQDKHFSELLQRTDSALYQAKSDGRNCAKSV